MFTAAFVKGLTERAIKTFAQVLVGYIAVGSTGLLDLDWANALSVAGAATLASVLTSIGNANFTAGNTDSDAVATVADVPIDEIDDIAVTDDDPEDEATGKHAADTPAE